MIDDNINISPSFTIRHVNAYLFYSFKTTCIDSITTIYNHLQCTLILSEGVARVVFVDLLIVAIKTH